MNARKLHTFAAAVAVVIGAALHGQSAVASGEIRGSGYTLPPASVSVFLEGTLGFDTGIDSNGIIVGTIPATAVSKGWSYDGSTYTNETTDMGDAGADDVAIFPSPAVAAAAVYFGYTSKFCGLKIVSSEQGVGTYTGTWQYYNGTAWATLTTGLLENAAFKETDATYHNTFEPPATWSKVAVNSETTTYYYVRFLYASGTVTTAPLLTTAHVLPIAAGDGLRIPRGRITAVSFSASTNSATNADSKFLLIDRDSGSFRTATFTGGAKALTVTLSTAWVLGDGNHRLQVVQLTEDGTTEFADVQMVLSYP